MKKYKFYKLLAVIAVLGSSFGRVFPATKFVYGRLEGITGVAGAFRTKIERVREIVSDKSNCLRLNGKSYASGYLPRPNGHNILLFHDVVAHKKGDAFLRGANWFYHPSPRQAIGYAEKASFSAYCDCLKDYFSFLDKHNYRREKGKNERSYLRRELEKIQGKLDGLRSTEELFNACKSLITSIDNFNNFHTEPVALFDQMEELQNSTSPVLEIFSRWKPCLECETLMENFFSKIDNIGRIYYFHAGH